MSWLHCQMPRVSAVTVFALTIHVVPSCVLTHLLQKSPIQITLIYPTVLLLPTATRYRVALD
jgi:hypothetical protein